MKELKAAIVLMLVTSLTGFPPEYEDDDTDLNVGNCTELHVNYEHDYAYYEVPQVKGSILSMEYLGLGNNSTNSTTSWATRTKHQDEDEDWFEDKWIPAWIAGRRYNWWQILLQNGGKPGTLKEIQKSNQTNKYHKHCERPLRDKGDNFNAYHYEKSDFKTVYRNETAREAFEGTPEEFVNVVGQLVWTPPPEANDTRGYRVLYALDDVGFWVRVEPEICRFHPSRTSLNCVPEMDKSIPQNLLESLIG